MNRADDNNNSNSNYSKTMKRRKKKTTEQSKQQAAGSRSRGCFRGQAHLRNINHNNINNNSNYDRHIQARALTDNNNSNCPAQLAKLFV